MTRRLRARLRRRRFGRALAEMHVQLRTEGDTPAGKAFSVALGTAIGCLPLPGAHLPLAAGIAHLLKLSRVRTYLAAHVNNPITFAPILYLELALGRWLTTGHWPALAPGDLAGAGTWMGIGREIALGTAVLAPVLAFVFGGVAWAIGRRWRRAPFTALLDEEASRPYIVTGSWNWEWVRGKLRHDPVFHATVAAGVLPAEGRILDLGCGRGALLALLAAARRLHREGRWADGLPPPPLAVRLVGVERAGRIAAVARRALAGEAAIVRADLARFEPPPCRAVVLFDVLHYLAAADQEALLDRLAARLEPGGVLLVREADAGAGPRFLATRAGERLAAISRGHFRLRFHYRGGAEWAALLARHGLAVDTRPMWAGTPFGNVLLVARRL